MLSMTTPLSTIPFLSVRKRVELLTSSVTNQEARPHLIKLYNDMQAPVYNNCPRTDEDDFTALQKVIERGIDMARS